MQTKQLLFEKIDQLSPQKIAEVIDFIDFIALREERKLAGSAAKLSEKSFSEVWDNDEDAVYDRL